MRARSVIRGLAVTGALALLAIAPASAQFSVVDSGGAFGENVLFPGPDQYSSQVEGALNSTGFHVNVDSTQFLHADGGQARVNATDPLNTATVLPLTNMSVYLDPGYAFSDFIFNAYRDGWSGTVNLQFTVDYIVLATGSGNSGVFTINNGSNFFTVTADAGYLLTKVTVNTVAGGTAGSAEYGLMDARQLRINNAQLLGVVPEPSSLALLAGGCIPLFGLRRFRRSKT